MASKRNILLDASSVVVVAIIGSVMIHSTRLTVPRGALSLNHFYIYLKGFDMQYNHSPPWNSLNDINWDPRVTRLNPELAELFAKLKRNGHDRNPIIQCLMRSAAVGGEANKQQVQKELAEFLQSQELDDVRSDDAFRPLAPRNLLDSGGLHLFDQTDGSPWRINPNVLTRGVLLCGPQGGGKSRFLVWLCKQLTAMNPSVPFFILDPKGGLKDWAHFLNATYVDIEDIRIDLSPPSGLDYTLHG